MANIVCGIATSHGPMLATPPDMWHLRGDADRKNLAHWYQGKKYDYESLLAHRAPGFAGQITAAAKSANFDQCQRSLDRLADHFSACRPDLVVILGNDQREVFLEDLTPAFTIFTGQKVENIPLSKDELARLPSGIAIAEAGHCPPEGATYLGAPVQANAIVESLIAQEFDIATSERLPGMPGRQHGIPHAFGYAYRRIMRDISPPSVPVFINVGVGLNRPTAKRCLAFGHALKRSIDSMPSNLRVAVIASGGLTHFCIDEALDQTVLRALQSHDEAALAAIPETLFAGNTSEIKSWLPLAALMNDAALDMQWLDYVPCYRTEAGTGNAMGFAIW
jgi:Catalytic LigB subunit of aromatic ring-opening dioxygenase